jgi:riboflavin transporter FmnP
MSKETETTKRIVTLGILSALGAVLMLIQIPYPFVPFLKLDLSDVVVLVVFSMYGWRESLAVGVLKAVVNLLVMGPAGYYAIGQVVAIMASMSYVLGMYLTINKLKLNKYVGAGITVVLMTLIMVVANYLFVTPIFVGELTFLDVRDYLTPQAYGFNIEGGYLLAILIVYIPFNLIKGILITGVYISISEVLKKAIN